MVVGCACTFRSVLTTHSHMFAYGSSCRQFNYWVLLHIIMWLCVEQVIQSRLLPQFWSHTHFTYVFIYIYIIHNQIAIIIIICWHICRTYMFSLYLSRKIVETKEKIRIRKKCHDNRSSVVVIIIIVSKSIIVVVFVLVVAKRWLQSTRRTLRFATHHLQST